MDACELPPTAERCDGVFDMEAPEEGFGIMVARLGDNSFRATMRDAPESNRDA
jgi:hypothetical protein